MRRRAQRARHRQSRDPRGHWLLLCMVLPVMFGALLFEGWTTHEVDAAKTRKDCTSPVPRSVEKGGPVLRFDGGKVASSAVPARTVALTYDGGPDPVWTPRLLDLLRKHHAHATFFLHGAQAAQYPDLVRRIRAEGHEIGSNTYTGAAMGESSPVRASLELSLTQKALAGSAGIHTKLLRLPQTTAVDTMCGPEWKAAEKAGAQGYTLVAADQWYRKPSQGVIRQFSQNDLAYLGTKELLDNPRVEKFTTVTAGVRQPSPDAPVSAVERWTGTALIWAKALGHAFVRGMAWVLAIAGGLGLLRLAMLVFLARAHVRRLTRFRPGSPWLREVTDPVTVLVPAYNEEAGIESTVRSLLASTHRQMQVIVIDDGSTDRTADLATWIDDPRVQVIRQPNAGKAAALNTGLAHARYDIVVMVDADTVFEPDAIQRLIQPLAHPAVGAVSGNTKVGNRRRLLGRWQHLEYVFGFNLDRRMFEVLECMPTVPGAIGAFRRDALMGIGGVSEDTLAEDTDLTMALWQAGWRVVYEESAVAWTEVPTSLRQLWRQRYRWCYGTIQAMWKHRGAVLQMGPAGRFGRRGLSYLALFQVALPLFAPVVDIFALYGLLFLGPWQSAGVWCGFLLVQLLCAGYALRLDGEKMRALWAMPFQLLVYRQLMYLVVIQSVVAFLLGTRLKWQRMHRSGTAAQQIGQPVAYQSVSSR
ncbi:cellulose synthase/poly-beta-1,6-N-acetylglucosamine synthase-like glycosyltransferase [Streptomyces sp. 2333.5]|uniref:bifunctional polysaccharide deacetylase/glycosyltransferase family 2 protein n=1 Tax=unclassified Streptomyces TaxID=2593676 RepID=UPI0008985790|nr:MULTISPECIES: glycosyltransferase [unclassified Streptomyces]PJJ01125.1 cellulose synthase/poly-beta-1,6-N-acetylglucosamine synthase-like glycosyltransferase [Streptomyces sp. 2333.5]SEC40397.1 Glycosyltransferase, catalytic subunit of cellulose synthase and poly-beta-1,6-N-acetylglucosamine synthase [Streptomyces sp. 2314.4]SED21339.1 Glycosyltransferase, catalytic subunit of cellulose synthase and poly-beta-1,6-N-acetylglucosamine synthase [Streptomyces sp. 2112.2]